METIREIPGEAWQVVSAKFTGHLLEYLLIAGGAYVIFYILLRRRLSGRKIQPAFPKLPQMRREVLFSLLSFVVFGFSALLTVMLQRAGWGQIYVGIDSLGWGYFVFSVAAIILIHDTWFYWTHRLLHWRPLFRVVHRVHHLSHNPTPWASFSFHPLEAASHAIMFPLVAVVLPMHVSVVGIWLLYMTVMNVGGHLGFEILPRGFARHRLLGWHNTSVHHDMHHHRVHCNFGLYFNVWDRLMGTNHPDYLAEHDRITAGSAADSVEPTGGAEPEKVG